MESGENRRARQNPVNFFSGALQAGEPGSTFRFTEEALAKLKPGPAVYYVWDTEVRELYVAVNPGGKKSYGVRYNFRDRTRRLRLGACPGMKLKKARDDARTALASVGEGTDPAGEQKAEREAERAELTVAELVERYVVEHLTPNRKPRAPGDARQLLRDYLTAVSNLRLSELTRPKVATLHGRNGQVSRTRANRALEVLSASCSFAITRGLEPAAWQGVNPCYRVPKFPETKRARYLSPDELGRFLVAVEEEPADLRDLLLLALYTGARKSNVLAMKWRDIDLASNVWTIPAGEAKAGETLSIALVPPAAEILAHRREMLRELARTVAKPAPVERLNFRQRKHRRAETKRATRGEVYVFPGVGKAGHLAEPKTAWARVLENAEIPAGRETENGVVMHDLRRTLGSWLAGQGASLQLIGKALGHSSMAATQVYARLNLDPVRAALEKVAEAFAKAQEQAKVDARKVVAIEPAR